MAGAQQDGDVAGIKVRNREIEVAIAVEVADGDGLRTPPNGEGPARPEGPIGVSEQHRDRVGAGARDREVEVVIAVEVADRHGRKIGAGLIVSPGINERHRPGRRGPSRREDRIR